MVHPQRDLGTDDKVVFRVESIIAEVLKQCTVNIIRSRLRDDVHLRPERKAAFGAVTVVGEVYLLNTVDAGAGNARSFLPFGLKKSVHVATTCRLPIELDVEAGKDIIKAIDAALKIRG